MIKGLSFASLLIGVGVGAAGVYLFKDKLSTKLQLDSHVADDQIATAVDSQKVAYVANTRRLHWL